LVCPTLQFQLLAVGGKPPVDRGRRQRAQPGRALVVDHKFAMPAQRPDQGRQGPRQAFTVGPSSVAHHMCSAAIATSSYLRTGTRILRGGRGCPNAGAVRIALRA
jgi:hypothetical protein